jgi:feruloyl esterase
MRPALQAHQTIVRLVGTVIIFLGMIKSGHAASCDSLISLSLSDTSITSAEIVSAGAFTPPSGPAAPFAKLPSFCRVAGTVRPTSDSVIRFETWMQVENWNGRYQGIGNLGMSGEIPYAYPFFSMASALAAGFATGGTDSGHTAGIFGDTDWALGHPEKVVDFAHRGIHLMTVASKALVYTFYGTPARYSYFAGCSTGGAQALAEAQLYPLDYNGVLAIAPANYYTQLHAHFLWSANAIGRDPATRIPESLLLVINRAVLRACDSLDGVADGVLEDPRRCTFDLASLRCTGTSTGECLTDTQLEGLRRVYTGPRNPKTGEHIYWGPEFGSELSWRGWIHVGDTPGSPFGVSQFRSMVFEDATWDPNRFDFDRDLAFAQAKLAASLERSNPDLRAYRSLGHKVLHVHGWSDPATTPQASIAYYETVKAVLATDAATRGATAADPQDFYRLFMAPGMYHCGGGPGTDTFDGLGALVRWVEQGQAPDRITAAHLSDGRQDKTRPLCPFPQVARYLGSGSSNDADSFVCVTPQ